jgi:hypothetical protein
MLGANAVDLHVLRRSSRVLYHKTLLAFDLACSLKDYEIAEGLLGVLRFIEERPIDGETGTDRRCVRESLAAARRRLRLIRIDKGEIPRDPAGAFQRGWPSINRVNSIGNSSSAMSVDAPSVKITGRPWL